MKQNILIGLLTGLLLAVTPLQAQTAPRDSDAHKGGSRLELGRSSTAQSASKLFRPQKFLLVPAPALSTFDRPGLLRKSTSVNEYYRSLLTAPTVSKPATRSAVVDSAPSLVSETRPATSEQEAKPEDRMFTSERIWVSNVYPNPASEAVEIDYRFSGSFNEARLTLLNILGSPIGEYDLTPNERKIRITTRDLAAGVYLYRLSLDGKIVATKKLLVRHQ